MKYLDNGATLRAITRRHFFRDAGLGIGSMALWSLLEREGIAAAAAQQATHPGTHLPARAKRIIYLFMAGAPSQIDLFDHKPALQKHDGDEIPQEFLPKGERFAFIKGTPRLLGSPYRFGRHGQSGAEISELLPHTS